MKKLFFLSLVFSISAIGQRAHEVRLTSHDQAHTLFASIKITAETYKSEIKKWPAKEKNDGLIIYTRLAKAEHTMLADYENILKNPRSPENKKNFAKDAEDLQKANNEFVTYFEDTVKNHHEVSAGFTGTGEIITIIFDAGKEIYDWVAGVKKARRDEWYNDVKNEEIQPWEGKTATNTSKENEKEQPQMKEDGKKKK